MSSSSTSSKKSSHKAKPVKYWQLRLRRFAAGEKFGRGERSAKNSQWHKACKQIESCLAHGAVTRTTCTCGYHYCQLVSRDTDKGRDRV